MLQAEFLSIISILVGFVCIVLAIFLFSVKVERPIANRLFGVFLILTAIDVSGWVLSSLSALSSWAENFRLSLAYLQMPFFLGFIVASCSSNFSLKPLHLLHATPFLLAQVLLVTDHIDWRTISITLHIQYYIYIGFAVYLLLGVRSVFREHHSDARSEVFTWLIQLVAISVFAHTLVVIRVAAFVGQAYLLFNVLQLIGALLVLAVITWITLKALLKPELFRGIDNSTRMVSKLSSRESIDEDNQQASRLKRFMQESTPHLDSELSLQTLSEQFGVSQRDMSELINNKFGMHFFDFVNRYRIESAKILLVEDKGKSILDVLNAVGFNSKSSFNTAFKKHTGMTPTMLRRM